jgi:hypothetical protein
MSTTKFKCAFCNFEWERKYPKGSMYIEISEPCPNGCDRNSNQDMLHCIGDVYTIEELNMRKAK